jgi:hypothetical protein
MLRYRGLQELRMSVRQSLVISGFWHCPVPGPRPGHQDNARHNDDWYLIQVSSVCTAPFPFTLPPHPCLLFSFSMSGRQLSSSERQAELLRTMLSSPSRPEKRRRTDEDTGNDDEDPPSRSDWEESDGIGTGSEFEGPVSLSTPMASAIVTSNRFHIPDRNLHIYARRVALQDKLRADQISCIEEFSDRNSAEREVRLFSKLHAIENKIDSIRVSQPEYQLTRETEVSNRLLNCSLVMFTLFQTNIKRTCLGIFCCSKTLSYKGTTITQHIEVTVSLSPHSYISSDAGGPEYHQARTLGDLSKH